jgi:hypothetical protein
VPSAEAGEIGKTLTFAYADLFNGPLVRTPVYQNFNADWTQNVASAIDGATGSVNPTSVMGMTDTLSGSSGKVHKCSLGDIMFLVMLILTKSATEQRTSRFEGMVAKKGTAAMAATTTYNMKMRVAEDQYKLDVKSAKMQIAFGFVGIGLGIISAGVSLASGVASIGVALKGVSESIKATLKTIRLIANIVGAATSVLKGGASLANSILQMELIKERRDVG